MCEDGNICFDMIDDKEFAESNESGLVITLGILACCEINLALLEKYNPSLKGLNKYLSQEFSDYYNAYTQISDQYGFYHSVSLESKLKRYANEMNNFYKQSEVEQCDDDITN